MMRIEAIALSAIHDRLGPGHSDALLLREKTGRRRYTVHLNSGGNSLAVTAALVARGYTVTSGPRLPYGIALDVVSPPRKPTTTEHATGDAPSC